MNVLEVLLKIIDTRDNFTKKNVIKENYLTKKKNFVASGCLCFDCFHRGRLHLGPFFNIFAQYVNVQVVL